MIYGLINCQTDAPLPHHIFHDISEHLTWEACLKSTFTHKSFKGEVAVAPGVPGYSSLNIFHLDKEAGILVLADGFIYNHHELSNHLASNHKILSTAELIFKAYEKWGNTFADKLNGDFAICLYLINKNQVILYRDHLGIRPLAAAVAEKTIYFATDGIGLCKALFKNAKIEQDYLLNFFLYGGRNYHLLPRSEVINIKPGHFLQINTSSGEKVHQPYWFPGQIKTEKKMTYPQMLNDLDHLLKDAVSIRSDKKFKASAHLSGGLDSGIVAVLARKEYTTQHEFYGFSWSPAAVEMTNQIKHDERLLVEKICSKSQITPVFSDFNETDHLDFLSNWRYPSEYIFEKKTLDGARKNGINLIFSGWGGDEFLSIGNYGIDGDLIRNFNWNLFFKKNPPRNLKNFFSILYNKVLFPLGRRSYSKNKADSSVYPFIKNTLGKNKIPAHKRIPVKTRQDFHKYLINRYHISARTSDWYIHGQRKGIEYRYPLLDKRIVEYMLKVPSRCLVDGNKNRIILRELGKGLLPQEVLINTSKDDPVVSFRCNFIAKSLKKQLLHEATVFKKNSDLNFVDFDLLENQILKLNGEEKADDQSLNIIYYIKRVHEFTNGYYGK